MPYLKCALKETFRLTPTAAGTARVLDEAVVIGVSIFTCFVFIFTFIYNLFITFLFLFVFVYFPL